MGKLALTALEMNLKKSEKNNTFLKGALEFMTISYSLLQPIIILDENDQLVSVSVKPNGTYVELGLGVKVENFWNVFLLGDNVAQKGNMTKFFTFVLWNNRRLANSDSGVIMKYFSDYGTNQLTSENVKSMFPNISASLQT
ncbi:MAG: hypothetical protein GY900_12530 [Actinomycetia bacterium]|nr:hypothetical protein [Actinomycetes bacterium]